MDILLIILFAIFFFFVTINYREICDKRYIRKALKSLAINESIIIPTAYIPYACYLMHKGGKVFEFTIEIATTKFTRIK